ncbi:hypothetical protein IY73_04260 [Lawsonella clevelandensis]|uniref:hypothetical protein n=1 Tax=Lawsonella clevelandensis TaxID=1528099 RepID=UPI0006B5DD6A|nr:hypothetical protein [Lawsonella clevelandensis]ALE34659.1 hypothetical protein IY73_04260 [Lawsonella clevelandensis]
MSTNPPDPAIYGMPWKITQGHPPTQVTYLRTFVAPEDAARVAHIMHAGDGSGFAADSSWLREQLPGLYDIAEYLYGPAQVGDDGEVHSRFVELSETVPGNQARIDTVGVVNLDRRDTVLDDAGVVVTCCLCDVGGIHCATVTTGLLVDQQAAATGYPRPRWITCSSLLEPVVLVEPRALRDVASTQRVHQARNFLARTWWSMGADERVVSVNALRARTLAASHILAASRAKTCLPPAPTSDEPRWPNATFWASNSPAWGNMFHHSWQLEHDLVMLSTTQWTRLELA